MPVAPAEVTVKLRRLHDGQRLVKSEASRFNVLACGRRWGKSIFLTDDAANVALDGGRYGWFAPNYKYLEEGWREVVKVLGPVITSSNKTEKRIEVVTGGLIEFWTLDDENAGRSRFYDGVGIDEAGMVDNLKTIWTDAIMPTLADRRGKAWFAGTPKGKNFFEEAYKWGQDPDLPLWRSWQMSTYTNPHILDEEIEELKRNMPERAFRQEFLAQFIEEADGALWKRDWIERNRSKALPDTWNRKVVAVDPATTSGEDSDETGVSVCGASMGRGYVLNDLSGKYTPAKMAKLAYNAYKHYDADAIVVETNKGGDFVAKTIREYAPDVRIQMVHATRGKALRAEPVAAMYELGKISHFGCWPELEDEMCTWDPAGKMKSPNRLDAMVYGLTAVMGNTMPGKVSTYLGAAE